MHPILQEAYVRADRAFAELTHTLAELDQAQKKFKLPDWADSAYALREVHDRLDRLRKEVNRRQEVVARILCLACPKMGVTDVQTDYCTATPDVKMMAKAPRSPDDPLYRKALTEMGVSESMVDTGLLKFNFKTLEDMTTRAMESGDQPPLGLPPTHTFPVYRVLVRKKKEIPNGG